MTTILLRYDKQSYHLFRDMKEELDGQFGGEWNCDYLYGEILVEVPDCPFSSLFVLKYPPASPWPKEGPLAHKQLITNNKKDLTTQLSYSSILTLNKVQVKMTRKLATIRKINEIRLIPGADAICLAVFGGWQSVVKKGEFNAGDLVCYIEIDTWTPHTLAPFLSKGEPREYNGVKGERLRTVTLRGALSQGLVLPLSAILGSDMNGTPFIPEDGLDLTEFLFELHGLQKWERPIEAHLAGLTKGDFPSYIRKTDQERYQNLFTEIQEEINYGHLFEVTVKIDGTSCTIYSNNGEIGVCSRNLELKFTDENASNSLVGAALRTGLSVALEKHGRNIALQGELAGEGIQDNRSNIKGHKFFVYDVFDIDRQQYLSPVARRAVLNDLTDLGAVLDHVPVLAEEASLKSFGVAVPADLQKVAQGKGYNDTNREGLVFKRSDGKFSFKAISNTYLKETGE